MFFFNRNKISLFTLKQIITCINLGHSTVVGFPEALLTRNTIHLQVSCEIRARTIG